MTTKEKTQDLLNKLTICKSISSPQAERQEIAENLLISLTQHVLGVVGFNTVDVSEWLSIKEFTSKYPFVQPTFLYDLITLDPPIPNFIKWKKRVALFNIKNVIKYIVYNKDKHIRYYNKLKQLNFYGLLDSNIS